MLEDRVIELETRLAFQEDQLEQLNQVLSDQQLQLNDARELIRMLMERIKDLLSALEENRSGAANDEMPPHY